MKQEELQRIYELEQQSQYLTQQIEVIDSNAKELQALGENVGELANYGGKEILALFGKGIFMECELKSRDFLVDVGAGILVKKNAKDTAKIAVEQAEKLLKIKYSILERIEEINRELESLLKQMEKENEAAETEDD